MFLIMMASMAVGAPAAEIAKHAVVIGGKISDNLYPSEARKSKIEGKTVVSFAVDEKGEPQNCKTLTTSGSELLDSATCKAVIGNFRFRPAKASDGRPIAEDFVFGIEWTLPKNLNVLGPKPAVGN